MGKQEKQLMRALGVKSGKKDETPKVTFLKNSGLYKTWYFETWFEKLIYVLGFVALVWTIIKLVIWHSF